MPALISKLSAAGLGPALANAFGNDTADNLSATGTNQATAYQTSTAVARFTTVAASTGCMLSQASQGDSQIIANAGANTLSVYPPSGHTINGAAANVAFTIGAGAWGYFDRISATAWLASSDDSANLSFLQSGTGALAARTVQAALRAIVRTGDYDTTGHYRTALAALTEGIGLRRLDVTGLSGNAGILGRGQVTFNGTIDTNITLGYNIDETGAVITDAADTAMMMQFETNYNDGSVRQAEIHMDIAGPGQSFVRPFAVNYKLTGANANKIDDVALQSWNTITLTAATISMKDKTGIGNATLSVDASGNSTLDTISLTVTHRIIGSADLFLGSGGIALLTAANVGAGRTFFAGFNNTSDQFFGGAGFQFTNPASDQSVWSLITGDANNVLAQKNGANAQELRVYGTTTGPKYFSLKHDGTNALAVPQAGQLGFGTGALATNATTGFPCMQSCAGTPSGTPASIPTGQVPWIYDSTNNIIYVYNGAWKKTAALT